MTKITRFACAAALLGLLPACSKTSAGGPASVATHDDPPQSAKQVWTSVLVEEECTPDRYLAATGASYRSPAGQLVLQGHVVNNATFASYKNPVLLVTWFSKNYTKLGVKKYPVAALVQAQDAVPFRLTTDAPPNVVSVGLGIASAAVSAERSPAGLL